MVSNAQAPLSKCSFTQLHRYLSTSKLELRYLLSKKGHVGCRFSEMGVMEYSLLNDRIVIWLPNSKTWEVLPSMERHKPVIINCK